MAKNKDVVNANTANKDIAKATVQDFEVLIAPVLTEKSMALLQNQNKVSYKVKPNANKTTVKLAFERLYKVKVEKVSINYVHAKTTTRGGRYKGTINGYKKAIITLKDGSAVDLFKE